MSTTRRFEMRIFRRYAADVWPNTEQEEFISWIAANPESDDVIPMTGGLRKVRWTRAGMGKRGGTRVIYYNRLENGNIWLLMVYTKAKFDNLPVSFLQALREQINDGR